MASLPRLIVSAFLAAVALLGPQVAYAVTLEVADSAPAWARLGAAGLLFLHIGGGTVGLVSGTTALLTRKGRSAHVGAGRVFFGSMLIAYVVAACVAPFLTEGQRPNFVAAVLALYLLISGVATARRRSFRAGTPERIGLGVALVVIAMGFLFVYMGVNSPTGTVDGSPPAAFVIFIVGGVVAAADEVMVLIRSQISAAARKLRHLWRMCFSFFIASGSLFLGQPQVFPDWFNASVLPAALAFAPLVAIPVYALKLRPRTDSRK